MLINQYQKNKVKLFEHNQKIYSSYSVFLFYLKIKNKRTRRIKIAVDNFVFELWAEYEFIHHLIVQYGYVKNCIYDVSDVNIK